ncbi:MAG: protease modulator HflC [Gammaproteobacteria bacterium]|nr:MAG: protease modulator HflC [Gammaproteobacteria bacterium]
MGKKSIFFIVFVVLAAVIINASVFTVSEKEVAIKFRFGEIVRSDYKPGLYFKIPVVNEVRKFDARILLLDSKPERFLTKEKKNVIVDAFVKWQIEDPFLYYTKVRGSEEQASIRLSQIVQGGLRDQFGEKEIKEVVSGERADIMSAITEEADAKANDFGIKVVDVRVKRIDLPRQVSESVYQRMRADRDKVAKELRAQGDEEAEVIKSEADKQRTVILAEAYRDAEIIRGQGDAKATEIYAKAFGKDKEFYSFTKSLEAYKKSFSNKGDMIVIEPDSDFFKYFGSNKGK